MQAVSKTRLSASCTSLLDFKSGLCGLGLSRSIVFNKTNQDFQRQSRENAPNGRSIAYIDGPKLSGQPINLRDI